MYDEQLVVLENTKITKAFWKIVLRAPRQAQRVKPGQFFQLKVTESSCDPLLRRPMSVYKIKGQKMEIVYEITGRGTALLAVKRKGDRVSVLGPLGNWFSGAAQRRKASGGSEVFFVGGGVGITPLVFLAEAIGKGTFLVGASSRDRVLPRTELRGGKFAVAVATEDGSVGKQGLVTDLLRTELTRSARATQPYIYSCGPRGMLKAVAAIAAEFGVAGEMSLDERMACGIGICLGCVVKTKAGNQPSCTHGPIYKLDEVIWE